MALNIGELVAYLKMDKSQWDRDKVAAKRDFEDIAHQVEKSGKDIDKSTKDTGEKVDKNTKAAAQKVKANFSPLMYAGLSLGLPAAAAVGAVGVGASLGLITAGFAAFGVAAVAKSDLVRDKFGNLTQQFKTDAQQMAAPLQGDVVGAIDDVGAAWVRIRPMVAAATQASAPAIRQMTGAVTDLAENAMPNVVTAVRNAGPVFQGLRSFAGQAGQGIGEFAANASRGAQGASDGLNILGGTVRTLLAHLGMLFANVASGSSGPLQSLDVIVNQITGGLVDLTSQGSGALGTLQGFSTAGSGLATILHLVLTAVAALPPQVTQFAGSIGAAGLLLSKFGVNIGAGFDGLGGKIKAAEGAGGKFKATMSGLAAGALNPATLATAGLGIALLLLGADQERAASAAAKAAKSQQDYTTALRSSKGAIDDTVRASVAQDLAQKNMQNGTKSLLDFAKQFGVALPAVTSAVTGETGALASVNDQLDKYAAANPQAQLTVDALKAAIQSKSIIFQSSTNAIAAEAAATDQSTQAQLRNRDAINGVTEAIYTQQNAQLGYRGAVLNSKQAISEYNTVSKNGKATEDEKAAALLRVEQAFAAQEQAAYQSAYANSRARDESGKVSEALAAQDRETLNLAASWRGPLPQSLQDTISKMSVTEVKAAGLTVGVNDLGQAVVHLPNGKDIKLAADTADAQGAIDRFIYTNSGRFIRITTTVTDPSGAFHSSTQRFEAEGGVLAPFARGGIAAYAGGGMRNLTPMSGAAATVVPPNTWRVIGDNMRVREAFIPLDRSSRQSQAILAQANDEMGYPDRATGTAEPGVIEPRQRATVQIGTFNPPANASPADIAEELDWLSRTGG